MLIAKFVSLLVRYRKYIFKIGIKFKIKNNKNRNRYINNMSNFKFIYFLVRYNKYLLKSELDVLFIRLIEKTYNINNM